MSGLLAGLGAFARDIKLAHSIFALPFALASAWLAAREVPVGWAQWAWILVATVAARSSAMGFNRIVDRHLDAKNPRTANRELPAGRLTLSLAWALTGGSAAIGILAAAMLHPMALYLSPLVLAVIWGYSLTKRFTALCHIVLGVALGLAPLCAWVALTGRFDAAPALLALAVLTWVAGFDILYSLQDRGYDQSVGLNSIPVALGEVGALWVSGLLHLGTIGLLVALPFTIALSWPYWVGVALITGVLAYEHTLVKPGDLSKLDAAFFSLNGYISLLFLGSVVAASWH